MEVWVRIAVLSLGGVLGVNARYWLGIWISRWVTSQFPWATFVINISGSFAMGVLTVLLTRWVPHHYLRIMVLTGFLGGYTTFSSFAIESVGLWERGERGLSLFNMAGSVAAGVFAVVLGIVLARDLIVPAWERRPAPAHRVSKSSGASSLRLPPDVDVDTDAS